MNKKQQIITALRAFMAQRSGIEYCNYGDVKAFRSEQRSITRDLHDARQLLREVELHDSITADDLLNAAKRAFSGRLTIEFRDENAAPSACPECHAKPRRPHAAGCMSGDHKAMSICAVHYCTGQYFPTEYRKAVAAVCASALWDWKRAHCMPAPTYKQHGSADDQPMLTEELYDGLSAGDWLRRSFRREFGARMQKRWFD